MKPLMKPSMKSPMKSSLKPQPSAKAIPHEVAEPVRPAAEELRLVDRMDFQFISAPQCSPSLLREVTDFLDTQDTSHPFQWAPWSGSQSYLALLRRQGRIQWFAQCAAFYPAGRLLRTIRALHANRGPVCDDLELIAIGLRELIDKAREMGMTYVDIAPEWTGALAESAPAVLARNRWQVLPGARSSLRLDLTPALDRLLASFRKTTRYEIRRSEAEGVQVTIANTETEIRDFLDLYVNMAARKQFVADDRAFLLPILRCLAADPHRGGLFLAWEAGTLRGGAIIVRSGFRSWYLWGATSKESKFSAGHLLQWRAIQWAKTEGCFEYDFGGFREGMTSGPAHFKSGFCHRIVHFLPPHRYVLSPARMGAANLVSKVRRSFPVLKRDLST